MILLCGKFSQGMKNATRDGSMSNPSLHFQAQATSQVDQVFTASASEAGEVMKGNLDAHEIQASTDVDPSTKDDECMSALQSQKQVKKEQRKRTVDARAKSLKGVQETADAKTINEQDARSRRIMKQTEARLTVINQNVWKDLSRTIEERSNALFSGTEKQYDAFFKKLDGLAQKNACTANAIKEELKAFIDVAEQHNALQIAMDVMERKLSHLKQLGRDVRERVKQEGGQSEAHASVDQQAQQLESQIGLLKAEQMQLMKTNGHRIEDSYRLAPLLRETTAHLTHDITLPPKGFNALILDKILPLKGDVIQTFSCLTQNLIESFQDRKGAFAHFNENLSIVTNCLTAELKSYSTPSIAGAILNACRTVEKIGTVQELHVQLLQKTLQN